MDSKTSNTAETHAKKFTHKCDFCEGEFECTTRSVQENGVVQCECEQGIVKDEAESEISRLAFWCSDVCFEEEFPEDSSSEEDDEDAMYLEYHCGIPRSRD